MNYQIVTDELKLKELFDTAAETDRLSMQIDIHKTITVKSITKI